MRVSLESLAAGIAKDRLRPGWRDRAEAQRSWWKFMETILTICLAAGMWLFVFTALSGKIHVYFHPGDATAIPNPLRASMSAWTLSAIVPIVWPILCLSGILINFVESLFAFTRIRAERGSNLYPELTIRRANRDLIKALAWGSLFTVPLFLAGSAGPWIAMHSR